MQKFKAFKGVVNAAAIEVVDEFAVTSELAIDVGERSDLAVELHDKWLSNPQLQPRLPQCSLAHLCWCHVACFDTPELWGRNANPVPAEKARDYLRSLVVNQTVTIERYDTDRYGRTVADLFVNGEPVGEVMVRSGHGKMMPRYASQCD